MAPAILLVIAVVIAGGCGRRGFDDGPDGASVDATPDATEIAGLLARYAMEDDPADGVVTDDSGAGRDAVCVGGVTCPTPIAGRHGMGLHFNGTDQLLRILDPALSLPDAFTIAAWIKRDIAADQVPFAKPYSSGSDDSFALVLWTNQTCFETITVIGRQDACHPAVLSTNTWFHLAGSWDGTTKLLYINGVRVGQNTPADPVLFDTHDMLIGMDENGGSAAFVFTGSVDDVRVYDRALTDPEVMLIGAP